VSFPKTTPGEVGETANEAITGCEWQTDMRDDANPAAGSTLDFSPAPSLTCCRTLLRVCISRQSLWPCLPAQTLERR
jgi:hypothetical protein